MTFPVRVLHFLGGLGVGGAETLVMNVFRHTDRTRVVFDAAVCAAGPDPYDAEFQRLGGRIFRLPYPNRRTIFRYVNALRDVLREQGPFIAAHTHVQHFNGLTLLIARTAGVPIRIAHSHSTSDGRSTTIRREVYRRLMRTLIHANATHLAGCSASACAALYGGKGAAAEVLQNAIDPDDYRFPPGVSHSVRSDLRLPQDALVLAHVGRFDGQKNHAGLVDAFVELLRIRPDARLLLIGDGPWRAEIEELCRAHGLENAVTFLGLRNDVPRLLSASDVFVLPSLCEGLPVAVVEAQMAGLPCVVSPAVPDSADIGLGLLKRLSLNEGAEKWAKEIVAAWKQRPSWEDRQRRLLLTGFDIRQSVHRWESLYSSP